MGGAMKVRAKKSFSGPLAGNVVAGQVVDLSDAYARHLIQHGVVEPLEDKPPLALGGGQAKPSASSPADQASQPTTAKPSEADVASLPSTQAGNAHHGATPSTPVTEAGGADTTANSRRGRRGGRRTRRQQDDTD